MNAHAKIPDQATTTDLSVIPAETALAVLTNSERFDDFYARVKAETDAHVPDVSSAKGRDAIKSLAFKVVKTKTAIDAAGKALTEEWRAQTTKVDAARKAIRDKLDSLRDEVRKPLTEWEAAEEARVDAFQAALARFQGAGAVAIGETAAEVSGRLADLEAEQVDEATFQEIAPLAAAALESARNALRSAIARLTQEEADRAELERLRRENEEREARARAEAEARAQAEAAAKAKAEAEERAQHEAEAQADRERQAAARAAQEAEDRARAEERRKADEAAAAAQREAAALIAEERRQREVAEAEAKRLADEKAATDQQAEAARAAEAKRAANRAHQSKVMGAAKAAIMAAGGIDEDAAKKVVLAIAAKAVPHVSLAY
jgi:hypothetical protein